jgi:hypothetical protein
MATSSERWKDISPLFTEFLSWKVVSQQLCDGRGRILCYIRMNNGISAVQNIFIRLSGRTDSLQTRDFFSLPSPDGIRVTPSFLCNRPPGLKMPERAIDHSLPTSGELTNESSFKPPTHNILHVTVLKDKGSRTPTVSRQASRHETKGTKLTSASWLRPVCGGFHNLIRFNFATFFASCRRHRVLTVTCLDACRCAAYLKVQLNFTFTYMAFQPKTAKQAELPPVFIFGNRF